MITITQLGRLVLISGALVSDILGVRLPVRKGEKFMILSKADIGAKITNVTAEFCVIPSSILFRIKRMVTITQLGRLVVISGALVSVALGVRLPITKGEKFILLSKMDIGSMVTNLTAELCNDNIKIFDFEANQIRRRPPVFSLWVRFLSKLDVFSVQFTFNVYLNDHLIFSIEPSSSFSSFYKYLPVFGNEIYSHKGTFPNIDLASVPKGKYHGVFKGVNQDEQQVVCVRLTGFVD